MITVKANPELVEYPVSRMYAAAGFFVLYHARGTRAAGVYVWSLARKEWDRVADLDELPAGEWCAVSDGDGFPLPLRLCRSRAGSVTAVWSREVM